MTLSDPGFLISIFVLAVPLSWCASWLLAARYRAALKRLMSAKASPLGLATAGTPAAPVPLEAEGTSHAAVSLGGNRRAGWTLTALLMLLSFAMALSRTALDAAGGSAQQLAAGAEPEVASFWPILQIAPLEHVLENWWPTIPAMGLLWRWRAWQILGATLAYGSLCFAVSAAGMRNPTLAVESLALVFGVPLLLVGLLCLAPTTRAIAPWLLPLFLVLLAGSLAGADLLGGAEQSGLAEAAVQCAWAQCDWRSWSNRRLLRAVAVATGLVADPSARPRTDARLCAQVAVGDDDTLYRRLGLWTALGRHSIY